MRDLKITRPLVVVFVLIQNVPHLFRGEVLEPLQHDIRHLRPSVMEPLVRALFRVLHQLLPGEREDLGRRKRGRREQHEQSITSNHAQYSIAFATGGIYFSVSAAMPGNSIPERDVTEAPPPLRTGGILVVPPALFEGFSESPPPTTETAPESATAFAS